MGWVTFLISSDLGRLGGGEGEGGDGFSGARDHDGEWMDDMAHGDLAFGASSSLQSFLAGSDRAFQTSISEIIRSHSSSRCLSHASFLMHSSTHPSLSTSLRRRRPHDTQRSLLQLGRRDTLAARIMKGGRNEEGDLSVDASKVARRLSSNYERHEGQ